MSSSSSHSDDDAFVFVDPGPSASQGRSHGLTLAKDTPLPTAEQATGIIARTLIPGRGKPRTDQAVIVKHGKIVYVGSRQDLYSSSAARIHECLKNIQWHDVKVLMPGMWDCHTHFMGADPNKPIDMENMAFTNPTVAGARNVRALKETLYAGFTSCVDLGGYAPELRKVIEEEIVLGPTLYGAGAALSQTAGHGDVFELPLGSTRQKISVNAPGTDVGAVPLMLCDGVEECRKAVRVCVRRGARTIKVLTSGGATSRDDNPKYQQFSDEELAVIVAEAKRMGLVCAAHAIGKAGICAAIRAGFHVIEHNSYADDEVLQEMKKKDIMLVATMSPIQSVIDNEDAYPPEMYAKVKAFYETHKAMYRDAVKVGVKCALGCDLFGGIGTVLSPGRNGREVPYAVKYGGMSPLQAIEAATANAPHSLGEEQAPRSGQIKEGFDADFLGLDESPLDCIDMLAEPMNIKKIWKGGKLVKAPGLDPWSVLDLQV